MEIIAKADVPFGVLYVPRGSLEGTFAVDVTANGVTARLTPSVHPHNADLQVFLVSAAEFSLKHDENAIASFVDVSFAARRSKAFDTTSAKLKLLAVLLGVLGALITGAFAIGKAMDEPWLRVRPNHQAIWLGVAALANLVALVVIWLSSEFYKDQN